MQSVRVILDSAEEIWKFVNTIRQFEGDYDLAAGSYTVDAKSILGVCALGTRNTLELRMVNPKGEEAELMTKLSCYLAPDSERNGRRKAQKTSAVIDRGL